MTASYLADYLLSNFDDAPVAKAGIKSLPGLVVLAWNLVCIDRLKNGDLWEKRASILSLAFSILLAVAILNIHAHESRPSNFLTDFGVAYIFDFFVVVGISSAIGVFIRGKSEIPLRLWRMCLASLKTLAQNP